MFRHGVRNLCFIDFLQQRLLKHAIPHLAINKSRLELLAVEKQRDLS
jgi:hypothetical protein